MAPRGTRIDKLYREPTPEDENAALDAITFWRSVVRSYDHLSQRSRPRNSAIDAWAQSRYRQLVAALAHYQRTEPKRGLTLIDAWRDVTSDSVKADRLVTSLARLLSLHQEALDNGCSPTEALEALDEEWMAAGVVDWIAATVRKPREVVLRAVATSNKNREAQSLSEQAQQMMPALGVKGRSTLHRRRKQKASTSKTVKSGR